MVARTLDYMMDFCKGTSNSPLLKNITDNQIKEFSDVYCELLNTVYKDVKSLGNRETDSYMLTAFYYKSKPIETDMDMSKGLSKKQMQKLAKKFGKRGKMRF